MAKSNFINYFDYTNLYNSSGSVTNCNVIPKKGQIVFRHHFTVDANIKFTLNFVNQGNQYEESKEDKLSGNTNITKDENNVYTFSAKTFPEDQRDLQNFQNFQIIISDSSYVASITFNNTDQILEKELLYQGYNNIFFRFSYDVNDTNCKQFNNCILYIEQDDSSNYTYTNWISPIASGNNILAYTGVTTESSSTTNESISDKFEGSLEKCIKATSSSKWTSAFSKKYKKVVYGRGNYNGTFKVNPSKSYDVNNLVRFQDIDLSSITDKISPVTSVTPGTPVNPGTPATPKF